MIGKTLQEILDEKDINVNELSRAIGVSNQTLYSIIKRDNMKIDFEILLKICSFLNVSVERFYRDYLGSDEIKTNEKASTSDYPKAEASLAERGALFYKQLVAAGYLGEGEDFTDAQVQIISAVLDILDAAFPKNKVPESSNSREVG